MRTRPFRTASLASLLIALSACEPSTSVSTRDAGEMDAPGELLDATRPPPAPDAATPVPVLPGQSWELALRMGYATGDLSLHAAVRVDARAESGSVRVSIGANGHASVVVFDVVEPGILVGRAPIDLGTGIPEPDCVAPLARIERPVLRFRDRDGDGVFEELASLGGDVVGIGGGSGGFLYEATASPDTTPPVLTVVPAHPIGAYDLLRLVASEPLDPNLVPYVEGAGRRVALVETAGSGGSHWALLLSSLPVATGYVLRYDGEARDLSGLAAAALPEATFDVGTPDVVRWDGFEGGLSGIGAEGGVRALGPSEAPIEGTSSVLAVGRTVLAFEAPRAATAIAVQIRLHSDRMDSFAPFARIVGPNGRIVGAGGVAVFTSEPSSLDGWAVQSSVQELQVRFPAGLGRLTLEIDARGTSDPTCPGSRTSETIPLAIALDGPLTF